MAYFLLEPFGDEWLRTASTNALIANAHRDPQVKREPFEIADFMPHYEPAAQPENGSGWHETKRRFMALIKR